MSQETQMGAATPAGSALAAVRELLLKRASQLGLLADGHDETAAGAAIERLLDREVVTPQASTAECQRYYEQFPERFRSGDLVCARHILFAVTDGAPLALIRAQAETVLGEARRPQADFAQLAAQYSNCPSAQNGGELGQLTRGECAPEFEKAVFTGTGLGVLPRLINTRYGLHIVAVDKRVPGAQLPFEAVREQIALHLETQVQEKALRQYVQRLAGDAGVTLPGVEVPATPLLQ
jgi:peptidyl-prolyl cis-trans isomerase C